MENRTSKDCKAAYARHLRELLVDSAANCLYVTNREAGTVIVCNSDSYPKAATYRAGASEQPGAVSE